MVIDMHQIIAYSLPFCTLSSAGHEKQRMFSHFDTGAVGELCKC